jgi:hypothetical protein
MRHYEMTAEHVGPQQGDEFYCKVSQYIGRHGQDSAARDFARLMPWGTPAQVSEKLATVRQMIQMNGLICHFSYVGMAYDEAQSKAPIEGVSQAAWIAPPPSPPQPSCPLPRTVWMILARWA